MSVQPACRTHANAVSFAFENPFPHASIRRCGVNGIVLLGDADPAGAPLQPRLARHMLPLDAAAVGLDLRPEAGQVFELLARAAVAPLAGSVRSGTPGIMQDLGSQGGRRTPLQACLTGT
jgi:hypothetical protein